MNSVSLVALKIFAFSKTRHTGFQVKSEIEAREIYSSQFVNVKSASGRGDERWEICIETFGNGGMRRIRRWSIGSSVQQNRITCIGVTAKEANTLAWPTSSDRPPTPAHTYLILHSLASDLADLRGIPVTEIQQITRSNRTASCEIRIAFFIHIYTTSWLFISIRVTERRYQSI